MESFGLLVGHLVGDYILQNDWMASNKANPYPGPEPHPNNVWMVATRYEDGSLIPSQPPAPELVEERAWWNSRDAWRKGHLACTIHCALYTLAVWLCSCWWMPAWGAVVCFLAHWPMDRFKVAGRWMRNVSGQSGFASGPLAPWSIVVVDNTFHLLVLFIIGVIARVTQ